MRREKSRGPEVNVVNVVNVLPYTWKRKKVSYFTKGENVNNVNNVNHPQTGPKPDPNRTFSDNLYALHTKRKIRLLPIVQLK